MNAHEQQHYGQQQQQPAAQPPMSTTKQDNLGENVGKKAMEGAASEAGKRAVGYAADNVNGQDLDNAKAQAQGLWAKYCGCLGSVV